MFSLAVFKENEMAQQMVNKSYRIAVTGFVGTGKTTLCEALANKLSLPLVREDMAGLLNAGIRYHQAIKNNETAEAKREAKENFVKAFFAWSNSRSASYQELKGFVADRCEIDLLNWWLVEFGKGKHGLDKLSNQLLKDMHIKMKQFDCVVFMPFVKPYGVSGSRNENNLKRSYDYTTHLLYHSLSLGLLRSFNGSPRVIFMPPINHRCK